MLPKIRRDTPGEVEDALFHEDMLGRFVLQNVLRLALHNTKADAAQWLRLGKWCPGAESNMLKNNDLRPLQ